MTFLVSGTPEAIQNSKKQLLNLLTAKVTTQIKIPFSARAVVIGKQGSTLKQITEKTSTTIDVQSDKNTTDLELSVQITGSEEATEEAIHEIDSIVSHKMKKHYQRVKAERSLHQFITGFQNQNLANLEMEFSVLIRIPKSLSSAEREELVIIGDLEDTLNCENRILDTFKEIVI
jgi:polyribonucleotide nucleotidyltransferase